MASLNFNGSLIASIALSIPINVVAEVPTGQVIVGNLSLRQNFIQNTGNDIIIHTYTALDRNRIGLVFVSIEVSCQRCLTNVRVVEEFGNSFDIYRRATPLGAAVAVNGGFYGYDLKGKHIALGLVVSNGAKENPRIKWATGGFLVQPRDQKSTIVPAAKYRQRSSDLSVIQSKPLLVENGHNGIRRDDGERFNRTALATTTSGKLIVAGAFDGFGRSASLYEFAEFLLHWRSSDGSKIQWAIAMDGGPGAQIYVPSLKLNFGDPGRNYVPNLVYVR